MKQKYENNNFGLIFLLNKKMMQKNDVYTHLNKRKRNIVEA